MPFIKGEKRPPNAGRRKGVQNKMTVELKEIILQALSNVGGVKYLERQARKKNAMPFLMLVGRVLPLQVKASEQEPMVPKPIYHEKID